MNRVTNMTSGNPAKLILTFAFPLILTNIGQQFYMIAGLFNIGLDLLFVIVFGWAF